MEERGLRYKESTRVQMQTAAAHQQWLKRAILISCSSSAILPKKSNHDSPWKNVKQTKKVQVNIKKTMHCSHNFSKISIQTICFPN